MKYMGQKVLVIITTVEVHLKKITQLGSNWNNGSNNVKKGGKVA